MKKALVAIVLSLALLVGLVPATGTATAAAVDNKVIWVGGYDEEGIYLSTVDGKSNTTKQLYNGDVRALAIAGDWIYFLKQDPTAEVIVGNIMKMKKDGSAVSDVTTEKDIQQFIIEGTKIYFGGYDKDYNFQFGSMNLDGTGKKILNSKLPYWSYVTGKGYLFFVDTAGDSRLYRTTLDGKAKTAISTGTVQPREGGYALFGDTLFYNESAKSGALSWSLVDVNGKNKKTITTKGRVTPISYQNQQFYYEEALVNAAKKTVRTLTRINRDSSQKKAIAVVAADDKFIGTLGTTFVYKTSAGKVYQITQAGKIINPTK